MKKNKHFTLADSLREAGSLGEICSLLKIPESWDAVIVCDGSATTWKKAAGWGWTLIQRKPTYARCDGSGGASCGSNIFAEIMGFIQPLQLLAEQKLKGLTRVYVITDCEIVKRWGQKEAAMKKYAALRFYLDALSRQGVVVQYRWAPRDTIDLNKFAHDIANYARTLYEDRMPRRRQAALKDRGVKTIFDVNPDTY